MGLHDAGIVVAFFDWSFSLEENLRVSSTGAVVLLLYLRNDWQSTNCSEVTIEEWSLMVDHVNTVFFIGSKISHSYFFSLSLR